MIKAAGKTALGLPLLLLGLSAENVARLTAGQPIQISPSALSELGLPAMRVLIHYGTTEQDILDELRSHGVQLNGVPEGR